MKKDKEELFDKISAYLDGSMRGEERNAFERRLQTDQDLARDLAEMQTMDKLLRGQKPLQPTLNFTATVMQRLDTVPVTRGLSIRNGIFLIAGIMIAIGISSLLISAGIFDSSTVSVDLNEYHIADKYVNRPLPDVSFDGKLLLNIFLVLNLVAAFVVLDRTVLRPFFQRRMNMHG